MDPNGVVSKRCIVLYSHFNGQLSLLTSIYIYFGHQHLGGELFKQTNHNISNISQSLVEVFCRAPHRCAVPCQREGSKCNGQRPKSEDLCPARTCSGLRATLRATQGTKKFMSGLNKRAHSCSLTINKH
jgi:hypothetical protein